MQHIETEAILEQWGIPQLTFFKSIVENSGQGLALADTEGRVLYANSALCRLLCIKNLTELKGRKLFEFYPPGDSARLKEDILPNLLHSDQWSGELTLENTKGECIPVIENIFTIQNDKDSPVCFATIITDITERNLIEKKLNEYQTQLETLIAQRTAELGKANTLLSKRIKEHEKTEIARAQLLAILDNTSDFVGASSANGSQLYLNSAGRRMVGFENPKDWPNLNMAEVHPDWAWEIISKTGLPTAKEQGIWEGETALKNLQTGEEIPVSQVIITHRLENGEIDFISTIMRDISERKRLEEQLIQAQKMEAVGQLAGGVAHDFNNLLQAILGYLELVFLQLDENSPMYHKLQEVRRAAERAAELTRQLLAFSRKQVLKLEPLNVNDALADLMGMLSRLIGENIDLTFAPGIDTGIISADKNQFEQVMMNLCVNARDAMPEGGRLIIETCRMLLDADFPDGYEKAQPGSYVLITVTDTGTGMSPSTIRQIFEPFFTTKELHKGTGLGLATVYGIIRQHQGMIQVDSKMGKGSCFKVYLPSVAAQAEEVSTTPAQPVVIGGSETILLAEDEEQIRTLAKRILADAGYRVLEASDGEQALKLYRDFSDGIALLFLDVIMPKENGRAVYEAARKMNPGIKCLFASGYSREEIDKDYIHESGLHLLQKPYTRNDLLHTVRHILDEKSLPPKDS